MTDFYGESHRNLQDAFDTRRVADALENRVMRTVLNEKDRRFVAASDMFFLTTVDHNGWPTVSYKGGNPGFVRILDDATLAFPVYDGNGMYYSMGNIVDNPKIGMLFIDFVTPRRLRVHGRAKVSSDDPLLADYHEARLVVRVVPEIIFTNCPRYIHRYRREATSEFVPQPGVETPVPDWKRVDYLNEALPEKDRAKARKAGPVISEAEYRKEFWRDLD